MNWSTMVGHESSYKIFQLYLSYTSFSVFLLLIVVDKYKFLHLNIEIGTLIQLQYATLS